VRSGTTASLVATVAAVLSGCGGPAAPGPSPTPSSERDLVFIDTVLAPVRPDQAATGVLFGTRIHNPSTQPQTVTAVDPVASAPGVTVQYMGFTDCSHGCPGSDLWSPSTEAALKTQLSGTLPLTVPATPDKWTLVFLERVDPTVLQSGACASVHSVKMHLSGGATVLVGIPGGSPVFGIATTVEGEHKC
jgi:hypothetical protein